MVEPMTDEERVKIINSPEYRRSEALLFHIHTRYAAVKTVGDSIELTRFLMDEFTAAEDAARDDERAEWAQQLNVAGPIPHRLSIFRQELFAEFARALGVEATRECQYCGGRGWMEGVGQAHHPSCDGECGKGLCPIPVQEVTGCPCKGEPIPLTLNEIVDAARVEERVKAWSDPETVGRANILAQFARALGVEATTLRSLKPEFQKHRTLDEIVAAGLAKMRERCLAEVYESADQYPWNACQQRIRALPLREPK